MPPGSTSAPRGRQPSINRTAWLLQADPSTPIADDRRFLDRLPAEAPDLARSGAVATRFADWNGMEIDLSRLGKPTDNAYIEAFNGRLLAECLDASRVLSQADTRERVEDWSATTTKTAPIGFNPPKTAQIAIGLWQSTYNRVRPTLQVAICCTFP
jgi:transposase InsO family protein